jgi:hypothetical protein
VQLSCADLVVENAAKEFLEVFSVIVGERPPAKVSPRHSALLQLAREPAFDVITAIQ